SSIALTSTNAIAITGNYFATPKFGPITLPTATKRFAFVAELVAYPNPAPPSAPILEASSDSGASNSDGITNDTTPTFDINQAIATDTVDLLIDGTVAGSRMGPGAINVAGALSSGTYTFTAQQHDSLGISAQSPGLTVTILATAPAAPTIPTLLAADDSGTKGDSITNVRLPHLVGTAPAGMTVQIINASGTVLGSAVVPPSGSYSVPFASSLSDGTYTLRVQLVDVAGNVSAPSLAFNLTIDGTPPAAPLTPTLFTTDDSGVQGDYITSVRQPHLVGTATPGLTVQIINASGTVFGSAVVPAGGSYSVPFTNPLSDGTYTFLAQLVDTAGNVSTANPAFNLTIDATPPVAPLTPTLLSTDDSGTPGDSITNVRQPHLVGTAPAGVTVQIINASGTVFGSAVVPPSGSYSVPFASSLSDGTYSFLVQLVDVAGNVSSPSPAFNLTIDTTPPATPAAPSLAVVDDSGTIGDGITTVTRPHLVGVAEAGALVQILNASGSVVGSAQAAINGSYSVQFASGLIPGTYSVRVQAQDAAGNVSAASTAFSLSIITVNLPTPAAPALAPGDDSGTVGDGVTNVKNPHLVGTTIANVTVQIINPSGAVVGSAPSASNGSYSVPFASALSDGSYSVSVRLQDSAGDLGAPSPAFAFTIDTTPPATPAAPALAASDDSGTVGDGLTNVKAPNLVGATEAAALVQIVNASGTVLGSATASPTGSYSVPFTSALADGVYAVSVRAQDAAGNMSGASLVFALTIDTTTPAVPSAPTLATGDDSGTRGDGITNVKAPHLVGTATAGVTVQIVNAGGTVLGSATATSGGAYSVAFTNALSDGTYAVSVRAQNAAGNLSASSAAFSLTIDTTPPATPAAPTLAASDDTGTLGDGVTTVSQPHLVGTTEPNALVQIIDAAGTSLGSATASNTGAYSVQFSSPLGLGTYSVRVQTQDAAGNLSGASQAFSLTITAAPQLSAPTLAAADDSGVKGDKLTNVRQPHLVGTATPGVTVQIIDASNQVLGSALAAADGSYSVLISSALGDGAYTLRARAQDASGLSAPSASFMLTIDGTAPLAPAAPTLLPADDTGTKGDGITVVRRPHLIGITEPNAVVDLIDQSGNAIASSTAGTDGSYSIQPPSDLLNGHYSFQARARDAAGNQGTVGPTLSLTLTTVAGDYDCDGQADLAVYRPSTGQWLIMGSRTGGQVVSFGQPGVDIPVPGDYDGVGKTEVAVFRPTTGQWFIIGPSGGRAVQFGAPGDQPVPGDYDGTGKSEIAVFRPTTGQWFILGPSGGRAVQFGAPGDQPVPADYDGDGKFDLAVYRPSTAQWLIQRSTAGYESISFGAPGLDQPVPADYDGDGKADLAVYRPTTAQWFVLRTTAGPEAVTFGAPGLDVPIPADYDGDGKTDIAVFRPTTATWYALRTTAGPMATPFGAPSLDMPLTAPLAYRTQIVQATRMGSRIAAASLPASHTLATSGFAASPTLGEVALIDSTTPAPGPVLATSAPFSRKLHPVDLTLGAAIDELYPTSAEDR
ncbi:MAG TPA: Ig-like domain-containing protein, partial [Isosphaeraceae bacterium]|nr:Ig-like domain-containing protein [Isosphaeraceae bacterium]